MVLGRQRSAFAGQIPTLARCLRLHGRHLELDVARLDTAGVPSQRLEAKPWLGGAIFEIEARTVAWTDQCAGLHPPVTESGMVVRAQWLKGMDIALAGHQQNRFVFDAHRGEASFLDRRDGRHGRPFGLAWGWLI